MTTTKLAKVNLSTLYQLYPNLETDYNLYKQTIINKALEGQYRRNNDSKTLCKILEHSKPFFPYITDRHHLTCLQDRISDHFCRNKAQPEYEKWHKKLPKIFQGYQMKTASKLQALFNLDDDGVPESISVQPVEEKNQTYTITVLKDSTGDVVFNFNNISQSITMASLSTITKAIA